MSGVNSIGLVSDNQVFAAALAAALVVAGWHAIHLTAEDARDSAIREAGKLVLITNPQGRLPNRRTGLGGGPRPILVAVGTNRAFAKLAATVERFDATAILDGDQPFSDLIIALDRLLRSPPVSHDVDALLTGLRQREAEAQRISTLTQREQQVLGGLLTGRTAAEIARTKHISMPTVRSHIRAVLTKLGVSSQVAAVAVTSRSGRERILLDQLRRFHQF
jgi:DNA-binding NarL/FixJ family response regulator